jgi:hypothetical protein
MLDPKVTFFFYLAAVLCFALAAAGESWRFGGRTRRGLTARLALVPLGLALYVFPTMWNQGKIAF